MDYARVVGIFNAFDKMTKSVIENCNKFSETAVDVGASVGAAAGAFLGGDDEDTSFAGGIIGGLFGAGVGAIVGGANKMIKYSSTKKELINKVNKHRSSWYEIVQDAIVSSKEQYDMILSDEIPSLKELLVKNDNDIDANIEWYKEVVLQYLIQTFQYNYLFSKGEKIIEYFDSFEERINSGFEEFSDWSQELLGQSKIEPFEDCYETVYSYLTENLETHKVEKIQNIFSLLASDYPALLTIENTADAETLVQNVLQAYEHTAFKRNGNNLLLNNSESYYQGDGFKSFFYYISQYMDQEVILPTARKLIPVCCFVLPFLLTFSASVFIGIKELWDYMFLGNFTYALMFLVFEAIGLSGLYTWYISTRQNVKKIYSDKFETDDTLQSYLIAAESWVADEKFKQKVNLNLIQNMKKLIENDADDTAEIKQLVESHDNSMSKQELDEVEQELKDIDYDF